MPANRFDYRERLAKFHAQKPKAQENEILIYGPIVDIAWWEDEVTTQSVLDKLEEMKDSSEISVRINSPGGFLSEGVAIYNALIRHPAKINIHIDSLAASAATIIAMAGDEIFMSENATMMIHEPWNIVIGFMDDMLKEAEVLEKLIQNMAVTYSARSGLSEQEMKRIMKAETWYTAEEAKDKGFVDTLVEVKSKPEARADLSVYSNVPDWVKEQFKGEAPAAKADPEDPIEESEEKIEEELDKTMSINRMKLQLAELEL